MSTKEDKIIEVITTIAEGNIGALNVLVGMSKAMPATAFGYLIGALEDHKIVGPKLWLAYKDYAKENTDTMSTAILNHSPKLRDAIRAEYPDWDWAR